MRRIGEIFFSRSEIFLISLALGLLRFFALAASCRSRPSGALRVDMWGRLNDQSRFSKVGSGKTAASFEHSLKRRELCNRSCDLHP